MCNEAEAFLDLVEQKGRARRNLTFDELLQQRCGPAGEVVIGKKSGSISIIVETGSGGAYLKVVVQGFLASRWVPRLSDVALHGFYKTADGSISEMEEEEFYGYD